jgi:copper chaperone CopZ
MHCGSCAGLIEDALTDHAGVTSAGVELDRALATVAYDSAVTNVAELQAVVAGAGYAAEPAGAEPPPVARK